mgnify:CR=1 FL=1
MQILYDCTECGGSSWGMLRKLTNYDNTKNMDELELVCTFCGKRIGKVMSDREFCGWMSKNSEGKMELMGTTQEDIWAEAKKQRETKKK